MDYRLLLFLIPAVVGIVFLLAYLYRRPYPVSKSRPQGVFFSSSLGDIYYTRRGKKRKPSVVLIHGIGASSYCWRLFIPLLEKDFDVITLDLWGFGRSHKDPTHKVRLEDHVQVINELMNHLKIKKISIIGCSMGGAIGLWLTSQFPDRVDKVVSLAPAAHPSLVPSYIRKISWLSDWTHLVINRPLIQTFLNGIYVNKELVTKEAIDEYFRPYLDKKAHRTFAHHLELIRDERVYNTLSSINHEALTLWGAKDSTVPQKVMQEIVRKLPHTYYHIHPEGGHHLMEEYPDWCSDKIIPFLKSKSTNN